ncbi:hypothetical protein [Desulfobacter vibrioformis]|uniref:hypothetical protein n=1 Tax=Desulfobacter vibrioformis TaxID=34031 RepID=UPI00054E9DCE|nr:hypothetical protein [Desulfobacter vibrioformis]
MPEWLTDFASICSILGLFVSLFVWIEAKKIRKSFLRRARLPEIMKEVTQANNNLSKNLKNWNESKRNGFEQLSIAKSLLENLEGKLPDKERKKVRIFCKKLEIKKMLIFTVPIANIEEDQAWELYTQLTGLITSLEQLSKDSKWD